jgi:hypothetical protein
VPMSWPHATQRNRDESLPQESASCNLLSFTARCRDRSMLPPEERIGALSRRPSHQSINNSPKRKHISRILNGSCETMDYARRWPALT